jgi:hypothetical protein
MTVYGYHTVPEPATTPQPGSRDVPASAGEPEPVLEGWSTEDPSTKKSRGLAYVR